jgi:radical SAM superfamily enzyme YgiQ (UPF0313 family)
MQKRLRSIAGSGSVVFIQLPLADHSYNYIDGNIPYAPATVAASLKKNFPGSTVIIPPSDFLNFASDELIVRYLSRISPDAVFFTNYLWNIERHLDLAASIKSLNPSVMTVFGGSEVQEDSWALSVPREQVDLWVNGEGEWFVESIRSEVFNSVSINGNELHIQPADALVESSRITEPLAAGYLNVSPDGSIFYELTRGCPYRCSYCLYSKRAEKVRERTPDQLYQILDSRPGISEVYILSPTFSARPDFERMLLSLRRYADRVSFHTELRPEHIDRKRAKNLKRAGFHSLELGVQTFTPEACNRINRSADQDRVLAGLVHLREADIDIKVGMIPGLPGDTYQDFMQSIERMGEAGLADCIEFYPLMVLPGAGVRQDCRKDGLPFMNKPPYLIEGRPGFTGDDILDARHEIEHRGGYSSDIRRLPDLTSDPDGAFCKGIIISGKHLESVRLRDYLDTLVFTFRITLDGMDSRALARTLQGISLGRWGLAHAVLEDDTILDESVFEPLVSADDDSLYRRMNRYNPDGAGSRWRLVQLFRDWDRFLAAGDAYRIIEPVLTINEAVAERLTSYPFRPNIFIPSGIYGTHGSLIDALYQEYPDRVIFEHRDEMRDFYAAAGIGTRDTGFRAGFRTPG